MNKHIMSADEIKDLATSLPGLSEHRLNATWGYIQSVKYNGWATGDFDNARIIFQHLELPIIKRLYPPVLVNKKIKRVIYTFIKDSREYSQKKTKLYVEYRKAGISMEKAREKIYPIHKDYFLDGRIKYYSQPYKFKYDLDSRDADLLFTLGIARFCELFYDRFYEQVIPKK